MGEEAAVGLRLARDESIRLLGHRQADGPDDQQHEEREKGEEAEEVLPPLDRRGAPGEPRPDPPQRPEEHTGQAQPAGDAAGLQDGLERIQQHDDDDDSAADRCNDSQYDSSPGG